MDVSPPLGGSLPDTEIAGLARRLWEARGTSLVLCDAQDVATQITVNTINHWLQSYGNIIDIDRPSRQRLGSDRDVAQLVDELGADQVGALLVSDVDLLHELVAQQTLAEAVDRVPLTISFAQRRDEFASRARFVCPDHHPLESWFDAEPISGLVSLAQPTIQPLGKTRSVLESLAKWSGKPTTTYEALQGALGAVDLSSPSSNCAGAILAILGARAARWIC